MQNKAFLKNIYTGTRKRVSQIFHNPYQPFNINPIQLKVLKHLPAGKIRQHKMLNGTVNFSNPQELLHALKELFIDEIYRIKLPAHSNIIDCGSNIGLSIIYLKKLYPDAIITAFEPDEENFKLLESNISSFKLDKVELKKEAVWIENCTLSFSNEGSMSSKIEKENSSSTKVKAVRLKDYLNKRVDFLKIDIEGAEYDVLKDIQDCLGVVENMFIEYHGKFSQNNELVQILDIVQKAGFAFYIKEADNVFKTPFLHSEINLNRNYDVQLNIFCFKNHS